MAGCEGGICALADPSQICEVVLGGPLANERNETQLEDHARLGDFVGVQRGHREHVGDALTDLRASRHLDECAAAGPDLRVYHPGAFEQAQRISHGDPAHPELLAKIALRRKPVAGAEVAFANQATNLVRDQLRNPA